MLKTRARMNKGVPRFAGVLFAFLAACAGTQIPKDRITDPGQMLFNGQAVAQIDCYRCHRGDATGTWRAPDLTKLAPKLSDGAIAKAIDEGPGMMPSYQGKIDATQVGQITAWLRSLAPAPAQP